MKRLKLWLVLAVCSACSITKAQDRKTHPHGYNIYKPQIIMFFAEQIGLEAEQREFVLSETENLEKDLSREKEQLRVETAKFQRLLDKRITGEAEAGRQAEKMLDLERAAKAAELKLIVRLKNQLTKQQNEKLRQLTRDFDQRRLYPEPAQQKRIRAKMENISKGMREMVELGVSPEKIQRLTQRASLLFRVGLFSDGEKIVDQALKKLDDPF